APLPSELHRGEAALTAEFDDPLLCESPVVRGMGVVEPNVRDREDERPARLEDAAHFAYGRDRLGYVLENLSAKYQVETCIRQAGPLCCSHVVRSGRISDVERADLPALRLELSPVGASIRPQVQCRGAVSRDRQLLEDRPDILAESAQGEIVVLKARWSDS